MFNANGNILLCDNYFVDEKKSTATKILHHPIKKEKILTLNKAWEGDGCGFFHIVKCDNFYRMYYNARGAHKITEHNNRIRIAILESKDGLKWKRINSKNDYVKGFEENNVIVDNLGYAIDNFIIFYDKNPACKDDERFKALSMNFCYKEYTELLSYKSKDGINFEKSGSLFGKIFYTKEQYRNDVLMFDTMNICFFDKSINKYRLFLRGFHDIPSTDNPVGFDADRNLGVRDIRYSESEDFINWSTPVRLKYDTEEYALYTNQVIKYYNAENIYLGFPTRYVERKQWGDSFDELCGKKYRKEKMKLDKRQGLAITDCLFMSSHDCLNWNKFDEAFITPAEEQAHEWVYGSCYPCYNLIETKRKGMDSEISMFMGVGCDCYSPVELYRYSLRIDGFVSRYGDYGGKIVKSNEFIFDAEQIKINFATSAVGYVQLKITSEDGLTAISEQHFGDKIDRKINFNKSLNCFKGKKCVMEIYLKDAHIYSINFCK